MGRVNLSNSIKKLETLFDEVNYQFFDSECIRPIITIQTKGKRNALGWCTLWKAWKEGEYVEADSGYYEINISAESLHRPFSEIMRTLIHEMVHLYNIQHGVKDCSRNGTYHNKRFKETAEKHGLMVYKVDGFGFAGTKLDDDTARWIEMKFANEGFTLHRGDFAAHFEEDEATAEKPKQSSRKYVCPLCETIIRATRPVRVRCADCNCLFV